LNPCIKTFLPQFGAQEFDRYGEDFTATKKTELQSAINALIGTAHRKMDTLPDLRASSDWEAEAE
jgi:hypothetical protein